MSLILEQISTRHIHNFSPHFETSGGDSTGVFSKAHGMSLIHERLK